MKKKLLTMGLTLVLFTALMMVFFPSLAPTQIEAATFTGAIETKFTAGDGAADDNFGYSVALNRGTMVIGAPYYDEIEGAVSHTDCG